MAMGTQTGKRKHMKGDKEYKRNEKETLNKNIAFVEVYQGRKPGLLECVSIENCP